MTLTFGVDNDSLNRRFHRPSPSPVQLSCVDLDSRRSHGCASRYRMDNLGDLVSTESPAGGGGWTMDWGLRAAKIIREKIVGD